ncbi:c-type cytochrome biogenesis protein CcmI [Marinobacter oulmenensis]|uniref:Cytochrome c-type biogenesis protein CcmH n=1 Tax=Marinobacter oulmenensis TaxID=643747 RepID=A0A840UAK0_9GAMM|nr:c-type cytochrome biogenesis protein CcmI [Marinobacter oulmenensis]MBB5321233.1 cytochrome c-type biogenesis protein CcmH [Marinobacter oulmenensis]
MTETFWIVATVFILFALAFVFYPVLFHRPKLRRDADLRNQNLLAYRTRLKELDDEYAAGTLDEDNYRQLKEELAGSMLDDVPENPMPEKHVPGRRSAVVVAMVAIVLLPAGTYFGYEQWGAMDELEQFRTMQEMNASGGDQVARMAELAEQLHQRLEENPDNAEGWAMLGQTYMRIEQYPQAAEAYERLAEVTSDDANASAGALGLAAQAKFFASQGRLTPEVQETIDAALTLNPDDVNALSLLGIHAFGQENYQQAIDYWERIVEVAPQHPQLASIQGGIEEAYRRLGQPAPEAAAPEPGVGVTLRISLGDQVQVSDDTTLFVFARPAGQTSGAPVAVARMTAGDLPLEIRLDDNYSMSPQSTISSQENVVVVGRLSSSGSINPQPGDWEGHVEAPVVSADEQGEPAELVIRQQIGE